MTIWQIWLSEDKTEGTTCVKTDAVQLDIDEKEMDLLHQFEIEGAPEDTYRRAFDYANWWNHDEGSKPEGIVALDTNPRPSFEDIPEEKQVAGPAENDWVCPDE